MHAAARAARRARTLQRGAACRAHANRKARNHAEFRAINARRAARGRECCAPRNVLSGARWSN
jgi:hypothetical protein